jgi:hypothetical protein
MILIPPGARYRGIRNHWLRRHHEDAIYCTLRVTVSVGGWPRSRHPKTARRVPPVPRLWGPGRKSLISPPTNGQLEYPRLRKIGGHDTCYPLHASIPTPEFRVQRPSPDPLVNPLSPKFENIYINFINLRQSNFADYFSQSCSL